VSVLINIYDLNNRFKTLYSQPFIFHSRIAISLGNKSFTGKQLEISDKIEYFGKTPIREKK
jgi:hypothetical protein